MVHDQSGLHSFLSYETSLVLELFGKVIPWQLAAVVVRNRTIACRHTADEDRALATTPPKRCWRYQCVRLRLLVSGRFCPKRSFLARVTNGVIWSIPAAAVTTHKWTFRPPYSLPSFGRSFR